MKRSRDNPSKDVAPVRNTLRAENSALRTASGPGKAIDQPVRATMEEAFNHDFSNVRVHTGKEAAHAARRMQADAFTAGLDISFDALRYEPTTKEGRALLAHELAHVVQQCGSGASQARAASPEQEAEAASQAVDSGSRPPTLSRAEPSIQRRVALRDVGRGEQSGFARRDEFVQRLNGLGCGLVFTLEADGTLLSTPDPIQALNEFGRKMQVFTDAATALVPLRLTNRHGLLGDATSGFTARVDADAWAAGYVDIDDMLASDDLGFQVVLIHFLTERATTRNYARRIGTLDDTSAEFDRAHDRGVFGEVELLRDFFADPTIRLLRDGAGAGGVFRTYRNRRGDTIRARTPRPPQGQAGLDANLVDVRLRDGTILSVEDYRDLLRREAEQEANRRLLELRGAPRVGPNP